MGCARFGRIGEMLLPHRGEVAYVMFTAAVDVGEALEVLREEKAWRVWLVPEEEFAAVRRDDADTTDMHELD
jgi:hypothetical protein